MEKKILIGSIISIAFLIGISFTSVVGYQSNYRTITEISPLFNIRANRALDKDSNDLTYSYVGMGEYSILSIPKRDNRIEMVQKIVDTISKMDDATFNRFIYLILGHLRQRDDFKEYDDKDIIQSLRQLRDNPDIVNQYMTEDYKILTNACTISPTCGGSPVECFVFMVKLIVFSIIYVIIFHIYLRINYLITIIFKCNDKNI